MESVSNLFDQPRRYAAYLVRIWQDGANAPWRASAQSVQTGEKVLFASLDALFAFLGQQTLADNPRPVDE